jgi:predicted dehydrogenase
VAAAAAAGRPGRDRAAPLGWGVLGATARVARQAVLPAIAASRRARLVAVASRGAGDAAGDGGPRVYGRYEALLEDPAVEAVYLPLPNGLHREWVERAAAAGKHVLCEKPLAPTADEARAMAAACARAGVCLFEAYAAPFHPRMAVLLGWLRAGRLGALRFAHAAFTFPLERPDDHRWRPEMGGGALLDVGVYCLAPLLAAAGRGPARVAAAAVRAPSGVDRALAGWLDFGEGFAAAVECAFDAPERQVLELVGADAAVSLDRPHTGGPGDTALTLRRRDGGREEVRVAGADPYRLLVEHVHAVVREGAAPRWSPGDAVGVLDVVDRLRRAAGLP